MDPKQVIILLQRYQAGEATPEEIQWVEEWYQRMAEGGQWHWEEGEKEAMQTAMETRLLQKIREEETPRPAHIHRLRRWTAAAAAAVILLTGAGAYLLHKRPSQKQPALVAKQRFRTDVAPGKNAAILTLAGGRQIVLDSSANGSISRQGNTTIINDHGQLAYQTAASGKLQAASESVYNTLTTQRGNQYQLILPDGSKAWLNAASSIRFPTAFTGGKRKVEITGEVYFEVARQARMPFIVKINDDAAVEVLGTQFNVNAYNDEENVKTTLVEGSVKVNMGQDAGSVLLKPGQQLKLSPNAPPQLVNDADVDLVVAWKNGLFAFDNVPIEDIMRQLSRWYDVQVDYGGLEIVRHYTGSIRRQVNLSQVLNMLELAGGVEFSIDEKGKKVFVKGKK
jgi:ferric-dicitrate binding protein FerR (iron transport regulator)